jgi:tRNA threonylcarbamoyladenosine biosynthesis protein TsaE
MNREIENLAEMKAFAEEVAGQIGERALILLDGPMGAGKTQFTQFLLEALGGEGGQSPSFAIHNSYEVPRGSIEHFDLFRLKSEDDLESTGFWDFFRAKQGIIVIEWASKLEELGLRAALPRSWPCLRIAIAPLVPTLGPTARRVTYEI